jgi:Niemann-Pick C1 protein
MSTFMAVVVIGGSNSYVFITFFRQLFLCTLFGVSHGLLLLPVLLSLLGPPPFDTHPHVYTFDDDAVAAEKSAGMA